MNELIQTSELKTDYWQELVHNKVFDPKLRYDEVLDTFFVHFTVHEKDRIITHSIDRYVAFLYRYSDKEIIGIRVEAFKRRFLIKFGCPNEWKLSKTGQRLRGIEEFAFVVRTEIESPFPSPLKIESN